MDDTKCKCGREAVFLRVNEGSHSGSACLTRQVERNFQKTISKGKMLEKNDVVAVGVSGGKDSMVLLHLMNKLSKKLPIKLIAVTVDEGIAGYRDRSIDSVKEFAKSLEIEQRTFSFDNDFV